LEPSIRSLDLGFERVPFVPRQPRSAAACLDLLRILCDGEAITDRVPLVGPDAPERLPDRQAVHRHRMAVGAAQLRQHGVAHADDRLEQQAGHDRQSIAHLDWAIGSPRQASEGFPCAASHERGQRVLWLSCDASERRGGAGA
jgi:hypothetical protein